MGVPVRLDPHLWSAVVLTATLGCVPTVAIDDGDDKATGTTATATATATDTGDVLPGPVEPYRLYINELMASNSGLFLDPDDDSATPDWVELYNPSEVDVDLTGFTITDDLSDTRKHTLDGLVLPAGGYLVLLADDGTGGIHLPFKLSSSGDDVGLFSPDGMAVDRIEYTDLGDDQVAGRFPDEGPLEILSEPTPGASNDSADVVEF